MQLRLAVDVAAAIPTDDGGNADGGIADGGNADGGNADGGEDSVSGPGGDDSGVSPNPPAADESESTATIIIAVVGSLLVFATIVFIVIRSRKSQAGGSEKGTPSIDEAL